MDLTLWHFLIVCPLVGIAGFVDAVAGGGGLISLPAYMIAGLPPINAIGSNKLSSAMGTTLATYRYAKAGYVRWKRALPSVAFALVGSALGARVALLIPSRLFTYLMLVILPLTLLYILRSSVMSRELEPYNPGRTVAVGCAVALVVGAYDGFYGPGTGTFIILLLTGLAHVKLEEANGQAKVINLSTNLASLAVYLISGKVIFALALVAGVFGIAGNYIGTRFFSQGGAKAAKPIMVLVIVVFFCKVLYELQVAS